MPDPRAVDAFNRRALSQPTPAHRFDARPRGGCRTCVHSEQHPVHQLVDPPTNVVQFGPRRRR